MHKMYLLNRLLFILQSKAAILTFHNDTTLIIHNLTLFFFIPVLIREREGYSFGPLRFSFSLSVRVSRRVSCCRSVSASIRMKCP